MGKQRAFAVLQVCPPQQATGAEEQRGNRVQEVPTGLGSGVQTLDQQAARSTCAHTWPPSPGARANSWKVAGDRATLLQAQISAQDPRGHRQGPTQRPTQGSPLIGCPRAPHLPPPRRWPPLRGALPLRARGIPGIGHEGAWGQGPGGRGLQTSETPAGALR